MRDEHESLRQGVFSFDGRRLASGRNNFFHFEYQHDGTFVRIWDTTTAKPLRTLVPLRGGGGLSVTADGHYALFGNGSDSDQVAYVAVTDSGEQITLPPAEFAHKYGWKNDPKRVASSSSADKP